MAVQNFRELIVWQKAMDFVTDVYRATAGFPKDERFGLTQQLRAAAVSIPSNIAEGQGRGGATEFLRFLKHRPRIAQRIADSDPPGWTSWLSCGTGILALDRPL